MTNVSAELRTLADASEHRVGPAPGANGSLAALTHSASGSNFHKLRHVVRHHRLVILRRGAVVAVSSVVSVVVALLLHGAFAGLFVWSVLFPWAHVHGDGKTLVGTPDSGGAPIALPASLDEPPAAARADASLRSSAAVAPPAAPALPDLPARLPQVDPAVASAVPLIPVPDPLGSVTLPIPNVAAHQAPAAPASAASSAGSPHHPTDAPIDVARGGFADESLMPITKGGGDGVGSGRGNSFGNGVDRGISAADREAQPINPSDFNDTFTPPLKYQMHPPEKAVDLLLTILPDGSIGDIAIKESCGVPELDEMVRDYARATLRWSPAYHDGKAITQQREWGYSFRPFD